MGTNLEPCPFCGSKHLRKSTITNRVCCNECGALGPTGICWNDAVGKWNKPPRRADVVWLPVDADGVPIRVGETLYSNVADKSEQLVMALTLRSTWMVETEERDGAERSWFPRNLTHTKPDSLEAIEEAINRLAGINQIDDRCGEAARIIMRLRKLMEANG